MVAVGWKARLVWATLSKNVQWDAGINAGLSRRGNGLRRVRRIVFPPVNTVSWIDFGVRYG
jgi:hypothetical protein